MKVKDFFKTGEEIMPPKEHTLDADKPLLRISTQLCVLVAGLFVFMLSIEMLSESLRMFSHDLSERIILITSHPVTGLFVGLLVTSILQSSSTTTTIMVAVVASGAISLNDAIPMLMGANIGTTLTSSIVAFGHITKKKEFRRAISTASSHYFFNILITLIFLPLEYFTGFLSQTSQYIANILLQGADFNSGSGGNNYLKLLSRQALELMHFKWLSLIVAVISLYISIRIFTVQLRAMLIGKYRSKLSHYVFGSDIRSLAWGTILTAAVQSSSLITSLTVPLAATKKITVRKVFPFIMGANIGTTVTALIASMYKSEAAVSLAILHFLFNTLGVLLLFPVPWLRYLPLRMAEALGRASRKNRLVALTYILAAFFILPFAFTYSSIFLNKKEINRTFSEQQKVEEVRYNTEEARRNTKETP